MYVHRSVAGEKNPKESSKVGSTETEDALRNRLVRCLGEPQADLLQEPRHRRPHFGRMARLGIQLRQRNASGFRESFQLGPAGSRFSAPPWVESAVGHARA